MYDSVNMLGHRSLEQKGVFFLHGCFSKQNGICFHTGPSRCVLVKYGLLPDLLKHLFGENCCIPWRCFCLG